MAQERTLVSFDWAIKYLLKNKADYVILEGFLTTLLGNYFHRMAFGSSKAIAGRVYSINIVYFDLGGGKDYIYHGTTTFKGLHYNDVLELSQKQKEEFAKLEVKDIYPEYYILKVNQFKNTIQSKLDEWMYYFKNSKVEPNFEAPGLAEADKLLEYARLSYEDQLSYDSHIDKRRSANSSIYTAKLEGKAEGKAEGQEQVLELMAKGYTLAQIKEVLKK